jgi:hypothetical protein
LSKSSSISEAKVGSRTKPNAKNMIVERTKLRSLNSALLRKCTFVGRAEQNPPFDFFGLATFSLGVDHHYPSFRC